MYRQRVHFFPKTPEGYQHAVTVGDEFNKLAAAKGWAEAALWAPTVGENELIAEFDYPDLATFQRETEEQYADPAAMAVMQKLMGMESYRTPFSELLSPAPSFG